MQPNGRGGSRRMLRLSNDIVINRFRQIHGSTYGYFLVDYIEMRQNVEIVCPHHGSFWQLPKVHLSGSGCPQCAITGFNPAKPAILYYLYHIKSKYFKSGITNRTLKERFGLRLNEFEIIDIEKFSIGADAYKKEQELLIEHTEHRVTLDSFLGNGGTEFFDEDVRCKR